MYLDFFGLKREPFDLTPDPSVVSPTAAQAGAAGRIIFNLERRRGLAVVIGDVGSGKTTLSRLLLERFGKDPKWKVGLLIQPTQTTETQFLRAALQEFGVKDDLPRTRAGLTNRIHAFLVAEHKAGRMPLLMVDEAQTLTPKVLETIRFLLNYETNTAKLIQFVLLGQKEFEPKIARRPNFAQRIASWSALGPVSFEEAERMISRRLEAAGVSPLRTGPEGTLPVYRAIFTKQALAFIHGDSEGIPRRIVNLADASLSRAFLLRSRIVTEKIARDASGDIYHPLKKASKTVRRRAGAVRTVSSSPPASSPPREAVVAPVPDISATVEAESSPVLLSPLSPPSPLPQDRPALRPIVARFGGSSRGIGNALGNLKETDLEDIFKLGRRVS